MDFNEIYILLCVAEKAHAQGNFPNIRNEALRQLQNIEAGQADAPASAPAPVEEDA